MQNDTSSKSSLSLLASVETWRPAKYNGEALAGHEVSDLGRIRGRRSILKTALNTSGYVTLHIYYDGRYHTCLMHRLVVASFRNDLPQDYQVNHINGIKTDNRLENLEPCTASQNIQHAIQNGLLNIHGENNPHAKLSSEDVEAIRNSPLLQKEIALQYRTTQQHVSKIKSGKRRSHA